MTAANWYQMKLFVQHATGFSMDGLHVILGVLIMLGAALLLRTSVADPRPLLAVFVLTLINEASDYFGDIWPDTGMQLGEAAKDVALTMLLPVVIFVAARKRPALFALAVRAPAVGAAPAKTRRESNPGAAE